MINYQKLVSEKIFGSDELRIFTRLRLTYKFKQKQ